MAEAREIFPGPKRFDGADSLSGERPLSSSGDANQLSPDHVLGLRQKPLDWGYRHPTFFFQMYQLLNAIQVMDLKPASTILEVGSGSGWATEILAGLNYRVICLEPSEANIAIAKQRVAGYLEARGMSGLFDNVSWQPAAFEDAILADGSADAILFLESFRHVADERSAVAKAWRVLAGDGVLCISGDSNWVPGNAAQEAAFRQAAVTYGRPFTHPYLMHILREAGFADVRRHHAVNSLIPVEREAMPVHEIATMNATWMNLFVASKKPAARVDAAMTREAPAAATAFAARHQDLLREVNAGLPDIDWQGGARDYVRLYFEKHGRGAVESYAFTKPLSKLTAEDPEGSLAAAISYINNFSNSMRLLQLPREARVLDVACGPGWLSHWCARLGYRTFGVDISADFIALAKRRMVDDPYLGVSREAADGMFGVLNLETAPLPGELRGTFDAAVLESCLHHFFDPVTTLLHVADGIKDGGVVLILEGENQIGPIKDEYLQVMRDTRTLERPYPREMLIKILHRAGLPHIEFLGSVNGYFADSNPLSPYLTQVLRDASAFANICVCARTPEALRRVVPRYGKEPAEPPPDQSSETAGPPPDQSSETAGPPPDQSSAEAAFTTETKHGWLRPFARKTRWITGAFAARPARDRSA